MSVCRPVRPLTLISIVARRRSLCCLLASLFSIFSCFFLYVVMISLLLFSMGRLEVEIYKRNILREKVRKHSFDQEESKI